MSAANLNVTLLAPGHGFSIQDNMAVLTTVRLFYFILFYFIYIYIFFLNKILQPFPPLTYRTMRRAG